MDARPNDMPLALPPAPPLSAARYTLAFLFVIYAFNYVDRQLLSILMEPIRKELHLSDTQLGVLSGFAFALFYATLGIPIARLADRHSRRNIIVVAMAIWSVMTAACGFAQGFISLLLPRIGVGIGEAGASPPAHSMLSDFYPPQKRAAALAIYSTGIPVGILLGLAGGGWLNQSFGWRTAFLVIGLPGVLLAGFFYLTAEEPVRGAQDGGAPDAMPGMAESLRHLWGLETFRWVTLASALHAVCAYGVLQWNPSYLIRTFGLGTREVGLSLGLIIGVMGGLGTLFGGFVSDWLAKRDLRWYVFLPALSVALSIPFYFATFQAASATLALMLYVAPAFLANLFTGPSFATIQSLSPTRMRAMAASLYLFILNLIGLGFGPAAVGIASDLLHPTLGTAALRWALCGISLFEFAAVYCFLRAAKTIRREMRI
ncbi:MAG TPA: MFS transporter [Rhizomicrobium sp.]|nr:MFS transporter [Rhizomicrobium sp.]